MHPSWYLIQDSKDLSPFGARIAVALVHVTAKRNGEFPQLYLTPKANGWRVLVIPKRLFLVEQIRPRRTLVMTVSIYFKHGSM